MTVRDLHSLCKKYNVKGHYKMSKSELVSILVEIDSDDSSFLHPLKKKQKVLNQLVENKKLILLQKIKDKDGNFILYHTDTLLVFSNFQEKRVDNYIVIGYLNETHQVVPLTKEHIYLCKEWNFNYILPENLSNIEDDSFQNDELDELMKLESNNNNAGDSDDDEDEFLPNYDDIL